MSEPKYYQKIFLLGEEKLICVISENKENLIYLTGVIEGLKYSSFGSKRIEGILSDLSKKTDYLLSKSLPWKKEVPYEQEISLLQKCHFTDFYSQYSLFNNNSIWEIIVTKRLYYYFLGLFLGIFLPYLREKVSYLSLDFLNLFIESLDLLIDFGIYFYIIYYFSTKYPWRKWDRFLEITLAVFFSKFLYLYLILLLSYHLLWGHF